MATRPFRAVAVAAGAAFAFAAAGAADRDARATLARAREAAAREREVREADLAFYDRRVTRDPGGFLDPIRLGTLHLERGRETGNPADLTAAESLAVRSLRNHEPGNVGGWQLLVAARLARHRFTEALEAAEALVRAADGAPAARAIRGEVLLELGRYFEADAEFAGLWLRRREPAVGLRLARWAELRRHPAVAAGLLVAQRAELARSDRTGPAVLGWLDARLAEVTLRQERTSEAARWVASARRVLPDDPRVLEVAARVALARGEVRDAVVLAERAVAERPEAGALATLARAWHRLGDSSRAAEYLAATEAAAGLGTPGFHRAAALALLDRGVAVAAVRRAAEREILTRPDAGGLELLAWARFKAGDPAGAADAIRKARAAAPFDRPIARRAETILGTARSGAGS